MNLYLANMANFAFLPWERILLNSLTQTKLIWDTRILYSLICYSLRTDASNPHWKNHMVSEKLCSLSLRRLPTNTQNGDTQTQDRLPNVIQKTCAVEYDCNVNLPNPRPSPYPQDWDYTISSSFSSSVTPMCFSHQSPPTFTAKTSCQKAKWHWEIQFSISYQYFQWHF